MAGDERIELPTVVLEDMKTPVIKYQIPIKPSQTANSYIDIIRYNSIKNNTFATKSATN